MKSVRTRLVRMATTSVRIIKASLKWDSTSLGSLGMNTLISKKLRTSFRALSITRIEIKESVIYTARETSGAALPIGRSGQQPPEARPGSPQKEENGVERAYG
jgi:hypothetical protein